jgi:hypothetical protein
MSPYTTPERIAASLGVTLSLEQAERAAVVADAVTVWIDQRTQRSWQASGAVADELHAIAGGKVFLNHPPVDAVSSVAVHSGSGGAWTPLASDAYELLSPERGILLVPVGYAGWYARVGYASSAVPPADIAAAADVLAADLMTTTLHPESAGAESVSVGQNDISVKYAGAGGQVSADIKRAIEAVDMHRLPVTA